MKNAKELLQSYQSGTCTEQEKQLVEKWFLLSDAGKASGLAEEDYAKAEAAMWADIDARRSVPAGRSVRKLWFRIAAAAAVVIIAGTWTFHYLRPKTEPVQVLVNDVAPGGNKAILTLGNGKKISLTDAVNGQLAQEKGVNVVKEGEGRVSYTDNAGDAATAASRINMISTPRGGRFEIQLPDGTMVWLNAATTITFPASFAGLKERRIKLNGEAYFEVKRNEAVPFRIDMGSQQIEVLGTHFNASNYNDEPAVRTTLVEGSVKVNSLLKSAEGKFAAVILKPGEQSVLVNGRLDVTAVDAEAFAEWRNNVFCFKAQRVESAMRQLSRWYDVEVEYSGSVPKDELTGYISRSIPLSKTIKMLEQISEGEIGFRLSGRKLIVSLKK